MTGVVVAAPEGREVRIAHDDIPDYMPAMTMAFTLADASVRLAPGDRVRFRLRVGSGPSVAEDVAVTGRGAAIPVEAGAPPPARLKRGDTIAPFALIDERGRAFTDADLRGHQTLVTFIFTRCPVPEFCPLMTSRFKALQTTLARDRSLPRDTQLLSITLDPAFDTPAVLDAYAKAMGAEPGRWRFAGGDSGAVQRIARAFSVYVEKNGALLDHTLATALVDSRRTHRRDLARQRLEAGRGDRGSANDGGGSDRLVPGRDYSPSAACLQALGVEHGDVGARRVDEAGALPLGEDPAHREERRAGQLGQFLARQRVRDGQPGRAGERPSRVVRRSSVCASRWRTSRVASSRSRVRASSMCAVISRRMLVLSCG